MPRVALSSSRSAGSCVANTPPIRAGGQCAIQGRLSTMAARAGCGFAVDVVVAGKIQDFGPLLPRLVALDFTRSKDRARCSREMRHTEASGAAVMRTAQTYQHGSSCSGADVERLTKREMWASWLSRFPPRPAGSSAGCRSRVRRLIRRDRCRSCDGLREVVANDHSSVGLASSRSQIHSRRTAYPQKAHRPPRKARLTS